MADITDPTNTLVIRQDRMALLTERDRVVDRLNRLENAASGGMLGGGGGGTSEEIAIHLYMGAANTAFPQAVWTKMPLLTTGASKSAGADEAFRINADGTLTVLQTGWYHVFFAGVIYGLAANVSAIVGYWTTPDDSVPANGNSAGQVGTLVREYTDGGTGASGLWRSVGGMAVPLTANTRIGLTGYHRDSAAKSGQALSLALSRVGAGPAGPQGPQGAVGPTPDITVTAQALSVDPPMGADADVTESPTNTFNFAFLIPKGAKGDTGAQGPTGPTGPTAYVAQPGTPGSTNVIWVDTDEADPDPLAPEPVHLVGTAGEPAFGTGYSNYGGAFLPLGFYKHQERVFLQGMVKKSSAVVAGETLFTLPAGYRPAGESLHTIFSNSAAGRIDVYPSGIVQVNLANLNWISLDGLNFRATQ